MNIGSHWTRSHSNSETSDEAFLNNYLPNVSSAIYQFPLSHFHNQADDRLRSVGLLDFESDLPCDESLERCLQDIGIRDKQVLRARIDSMKKEDICRRIRLYADTINATPSLILSHYTYSIYLRRYGPDLRNFCPGSSHSEQFRDLTSDCTWITSNKTNFGISIDTTHEDTANKKKKQGKLIEVITALWEQATITGLFLRSLMSDKVVKYNYHPIIALPNLTSKTTKRFLCFKHQRNCMTKESLENLDKYFKQFREVSLFCKPYPMTDPKYTQDSDYLDLVQRCILLSYGIKMHLTYSYSY